MRLRVGRCTPRARKAANGGPKYSGLHALRHFFASWFINRKRDGGLELPLKTGNLNARGGT